MIDLIDTLDAAGVGSGSDPEAVDVVGHSYGGVIALHLLALHPERVRRLVLLDPAPALPGERGSREALATIADPGWATVEEATAARAAGLLPGTEAAVAEDIAEHLVEGDDGRFRFRCHKPAVVTGWGELCRPLPPIASPRPTLLVIAARADFVSADVVAELHSMLDPHLTVTTLDSGHMLYWDRFDETVAAVNEFLRAENAGVAFLAR